MVEPALREHPLGIPALMSQDPVQARTQVNVSLNLRLVLTPSCGDLWYCALTCGNF
jgi:hypothetical protein